MSTHLDCDDVRELLERRTDDAWQAADTLANLATTNSPGDVAFTEDARALQQKIQVAERYLAARRQMTRLRVLLLQEGCL